MECIVGPLIVMLAPMPAHFHLFMHHSHSFALIRSLSSSHSPIFALTLLLSLTPLLSLFCPHSPTQVAQVAGQQQQQTVVSTPHLLQQQHPGMAMANALAVAAANQSNNQGAHGAHAQLSLPHGMGGSGVSLQQLGSGGTLGGQGQGEGGAGQGSQLLDPHSYNQGLQQQQQRGGPGAGPLQGGNQLDVATLLAATGGDPQKLLAVVGGDPSKLLALVNNDHAKLVALVGGNPQRVHELALQAAQPQAAQPQQQQMLQQQQQGGPGSGAAGQQQQQQQMQQQMMQQAQQQQQMMQQAQQQQQQLQIQLAQQQQQPGPPQGPSDAGAPPGGGLVLSTEPAAAYTIGDLLHLVALGQVAIPDVPEAIRQKIMYLLNPAVLEHAPVRRHVEGSVGQGGAGRGRGRNERDGRSGGSVGEESR